MFFDVENYPIRTTINVMHYQNGKLWGGCSGMLVGKNFVLTAAHCVRSYFPSEGFWYDSIVAVPAYDNGQMQPVLQSSEIKKYYIFKNYYDLKRMDDIALLELKKPIGEEIGWVGIAYSNNPTFYTNKVFHKLSYPGRASLVDPSKIYNGDTLYYNYGKIDNIREGLGVTIHAYGIPGQSGSSFFYTDNSNYFSVGVFVWANDYWHHKIDNHIFYQFKNILKGNLAQVTQKGEEDNIFDIFPNPSSGVINLRFKVGKPEFYKIAFANMQGLELFSQKLLSSEISSLTLPELDNGVYLFTVRNENEKYVKKLMIQH